jgi:nitrite reductase/ring-hydroxylating ferredoxin subunit
VSAHRIGTLAELTVGQGRAYAVDGEQVAVFLLRSGEVRAVSAVCPHRGGPLADGLADEHVVVCPLHGNAYALANGCSPTGQAPVRVFDVTLDGDDVLVHVPGRVARRGAAPDTGPLPEAGAGRPVAEPVRAGGGVPVAS